MQNKRMKSFFTSIIILSCVYVFARNNHLFASELDPVKVKNTYNQATELMNTGKVSEAFELLAPLELEMAGNVDYDYLLGIVALEAGHPVKATLALERVLLMQPNFAGARLDLGRAYFAIGSYSKAIIEFKEVLLSNPPPEAQKAAEFYIIEIKKRLEPKRTHYNGYITAAVGYDTNVNNSTDNERVFVPSLSVDMILSPTNVQIPDNYAELRTGLGVEHQWTSKWLSFFSVDGASKALATENDFETDQANMRFGMGFNHGKHVLRAGFNSQFVWVEGESNESLELSNSENVGGNLEWRYLLNSWNQLVGFSQYASIRYPDVKVNNMEQYVGGLSWLHVVKDLKKTLLSFSSYGGYAFETEGRADGDNSLYAWNVGGQSNLNEKSLIFFGIGEQYNDYKKWNQAFMQTRGDRQTDYRIGLNVQVARNFLMRLAVNLTENDSNIPIYEYKRLDFSAAFRYDFL